MAGVASKNVAREACMHVDDRLDSMRALTDAVERAAATRGYVGPRDEVALYTQNRFQSKLESVRACMDADSTEASATVVGPPPATPGMEAEPPVLVAGAGTVGDEELPPPPHPAATSTPINNAEGRSR